MTYPGMEEQIYWNKCACNEVDAMRRRHFLDTVPKAGPLPASHYYKLISNELGSMAKEVLRFGGRIPKVDHATLMSHTRAKIRGRYKQAYHNICTQRVNAGRADHKIKAFVKYEKIPIGKWEDGKPPRLIQFRSYEYLYHLKARILGYDLRIKEFSSEMRFNGQPVADIFTKLHDNYGIAKALRNNWDYFVDPMAICLDASKYDGHYKTENMTCEHDYWKEVLEKDRRTNEILSQQLTTEGHSAMGVKFKSGCNRSSGEFTTSDGNGNSNYATLSSYCKASGLREDEFRISVNGDDSVIFIDVSNRKKLLPLSWFTNVNMEMEMDREVTDFERISYCQASPIRVMHEGKLQWFMVKEPHRTMSRCCYAPTQSLSCIDRYLTSVGLCELACNRGVPVLQSFAIAVLGLSGYKRPLGAFDRFAALSSGNELGLETITMETRRDFESAFGISIIEQMCMERSLAASAKNHPDSQFLNRYQGYVNNSKKNPQQ